MISITSYHGNSASAENNAKLVKVNDVSFYFSYETLVAINTGKNLKVIKNYWGPTTGKHLNAIDGGDQAAKDIRLEKEQFEGFVKQINLSIAIPS